MSATKKCAGAPRTGLSIICPHCDGSGRLPLGRASVGTMILAARKKSGMTQEELSRKVMLSRAQIANVEGGRSDMPIKTLVRFAEALGVPTKDLVP